MSKYKDKIKNLPRVTLDVISEVCRDMLPSEYRSHPWDLPYADKNFAKIFDVQNKKFITITCTKCGYTELYK